MGYYNQDEENSNTYMKSKAKSNVNMNTTNIYPNSNRNNKFV